MAANHGMIRRKEFTTYTMIRDVGQSPTILKIYYIPEFMFGQMETTINHDEELFSLFKNSWLSKRARIVWHTPLGP